jgi:hypothetical protein
VSSDPPRFLDRPLDAAIDLLTEAERVTFVVGAGASMEAGLPSWGQLVTGITTQIRAGLAPGDLAELRRALSEVGALEAAAMLRTWFADDNAFRRAVRASLYQGRDPALYSPGPIGTEIGRWVAAQPDHTDVATLNYDDLLERAITNADPDLDPAGVFGSRLPRGKYPVRHLHGRLYGRYTDQIVLTEVDYARWGGQNDWQDPFVREAMQHSLVVFIGLSFTDQNLLRWIYHPDPVGRARLALVARESQARRSDAVQHQIEAASDRRLAAANVTVGRANFFAELGQILHEARRRRGRGRRPRAFAARATERLGKATRRLERTRSPQTLAGWADALQQTLDAATTALSASASLNPQERLGLGLWAADHAAGSVRLLAASDRVYLRPEARKEAPLMLDSPWVAVRAVTRGVPVVQSTDGGRWRTTRGVPLVWKGTPEREDRIPVGAFTLTSNLPDGSTLWDRAEERAPGSVVEIESSIHDLLIKFWN